MKNWKLTCTDGFTKTVSAATQEEAVDMFMTDTDVTAHVTQNHPDWTGKSPEEMKQGVMGMVAEEMVTPAGGDMGGGMPAGGVI